MDKVFDYAAARWGDAGEKLSRAEFDELMANIIKEINAVESNSATKRVRHYRNKAVAHMVPEDYEVRLADILLVAKELFSVGSALQHLFRAGVQETPFSRLQSFYADGSCELYGIENTKRDILVEAEALASIFRD